MKNKTAIGIIAVLVVIGIFAWYFWQGGQQSTTQNISAKISPADAKQTAEKYIAEPNTAGEPTLINADGKITYIVPIMLNGNQIGEVFIDAQTGKFIDGFGISNEK